MQVAAVARVPPERLQFIVAPESVALGAGTSEVPGLGGGRGLVGGWLGVVSSWKDGWVD